MRPTFCVYPQTPSSCCCMKKKPGLRFVGVSTFTRDVTRAHGGSLSNLLPSVAVDGGTAWMARDSVVLEADAVDAAHAGAPWLDLALQLKQDLASIILMSEEELQVRVIPRRPLQSCISTGGPDPVLGSPLSWRL